jgi:Rps23 Pro-64 3,4-dihydroxylase Tpa1-like proline 4-hydroxylase
MFNKLLCDEKQLQKWKEEFNNAKPFRFLVIDNFLEPKLAIDLSKAFPSLGQMNVNYKGLNEQKSEHSEFDNLPEFTELKKILSCYQITTAIEAITQIENTELINDRFGYGLHQGGKNSFLDVHIDYNLHPTEKKQRRLNLILFLNEHWEKNWGGALELWNKDVTVCEQSILPTLNRCVLFECNEYSFHGYSKINCPDGITRKSFYQYYFTEAKSKIIFHDTIFRSRPQESLAKKILVPVKETSKNTVKRVLYYLGFSKFLK